MRSAASRALVQDVADKVQAFVPAGDEHQLDAMIAGVQHPQHQAIIHEAIRHGVNHYQKYFAAAVAAILVREQMQPNSAVALLPATLVPGANATPGVTYALVPFIGNAAQGNYQFVRGQRFYGLLTETVDSVAGWHITSGSLKLATDAISGINYGDASFALFQQDVVLGRTITGEYERHEFLEEVTFTASAVLKAAAPAPMTVGLQLQFWDNRCSDRRYFDLGALAPDFGQLVREIMHEVNAGVPHQRLLRRRLMARG